jgi:hypothetical protein
MIKMNPLDMWNLVWLCVINIAIFFIFWTQAGEQHKLKYDTVMDNKYYKISLGFYYKQDSSTSIETISE